MKISTNDSILATGTLVASSILGLTMAVLSTGCTTQDETFHALDTTHTKSLIAMQKGRYTLAKGIGCSWGEIPKRPHVSVLIAKEKIWIDLSTWSYDYFEEFDALAHHEDLQSQSWQISKEDGEFDWPALEKALAEVRELVPTRKYMWGEQNELEIAAEQEVPYHDILNVMDVAVATRFASFGYVEPHSLPEWLKE